MEDHFSKISRKKFIVSSSLAAFSLSPLVSFLSSCYGFNGDDISNQCTDDEFHYFGDNLTNLHFYFINGQIHRKQLVLNKGCPSFMIVKIPQQHIAEKLLTRAQVDEHRDDHTNSYFDGNDNLDSQIAGFSFLAFQLYPKADMNTRRKIDLSEPEVLLQWDNRELFDLVMPDAEKFKQFADSYCDFQKNGTLGIKELAVSVYEFYKKVCATVLNCGLFVPMTILEIPQGMFVVPHPPADVKKNGKVSGTRALFSSGDIKKQRYVYQTDDGTVNRSVQELWNSQMWFQQFEWDETKKEERSIGEKTNPSFRPAAYITFDGAPTDSCKPSAECEDPDKGYLPEFLDKQELVYIASLGRSITDPKDTTKKIRMTGNTDWNIETKGLTFTGLGAITKFHYKNFKPPVGTDLVEYEHHITLGRDEFIKVARIGVISCTGQRALHVKIGQRKINAGVSYMEFYQYIEIVQKDITYFDSSLFIENEPHPDEPYNYIQARGYSDNYRALNPDKPADGILHSYDDIYDGQLNNIDNNDVWRDRDIWSLSALPGNWNTHYRRWPFKKISALTLRSNPIRVLENTPTQTNTYPSINCPLAFWPALDDGSYPDCTFNFVAYDWNNSPVRFTSNFLFLRKSLIETPDTSVNFPRDIFMPMFFQQPIERRQIGFINTKIALTPDFVPQYQGDQDQQSLPNKSNNAKTDYFEYYFSLCKEEEGLLAFYNPKKGIVDDQGKSIQSISIFNERIFPLFPQLKKALVYIDSIQDYSPDPVPSLVEYNQDYIDYGMNLLAPVKVLPAANFAPAVKTVYNKARLILNHTDAFINNTDKLLNYVDGRWIARAEQNGYEKIKRLFSGAGKQIGGLVNPDFDIPCVGLVKQSISVGKDINRKYLSVTGSAQKVADRIENFNPSDLLRQMPEIFHGVNLLAILKTIFPEYEAPINEIKNIGATLDASLAEVRNNKVYREIQTDVATANTLVQQLKSDIEGIKGKIDDQKAELKKLTDQLNAETLFAQAQTYVQSCLLKLQTGFLEYRNEAIVLAQGQLDAAADYCFTEFASKADPFINYYTIINNNLEQCYDAFKASGQITDQQIANIRAAIKARFGPDAFVFIDISATTVDSCINTYDIIRTAINQAATECYTTLQGYQKAIDDFNLKNQTYQTTGGNLTELQAAHDTLTANKDSYTKLLTLPAPATISKVIYDIVGMQPVISQYRNKLDQVDDACNQLAALVFNTGIKGLIVAAQNASSALKVFNSKLTDDYLTLINRVLTAKKLVQLLSDARNKLKDFYDKDPFNRLRSNAGEFIRQSNPFVAAYKYVSGPILWSGLTQDAKQITAILGLPDDDYKINFLSPADMAGIKGNISDIRKRIQTAQDTINGYESSLRASELKYETALQQQVAAGSVDLISFLLKKIDDLQQQLLSDPNNVEALNMLIQAKNLYNLLTSLTQKEVNFSWQTSSFHDADFGIVKFLASENPKTSLTVAVKETIYFQPAKFPAVVSRIDSSIENRLANFGMSLLDVLILNFNEVSFTAGSGQSPQFNVKIRDVQFGGALTFVQALQDWLKSLLGDAFRIRIQPDNVDISYTLAIPAIQTPGFNFFNLSLNFDFQLFFNSKPIRLGFSLARPDSKFGISVGIYAGFGYFGIVAETKRGIIETEIALEFGGYFGFSLGPLRGEIKLVAGLYYKHDDSGVTIEGYFLCEGRVQLWFVMVSARFYMGIRSQSNYVEGRCSVSYSIKIGCFFSLSFEATYYKKIAGASPSNNSSGGQLPAAETYDEGLQMRGATANASPAAIPLTGNPSNQFAAARPDTAMRADEYTKVVLQGADSTRNATTNPIKRQVMALSVEDWGEWLDTFID